MKRSHNSTSNVFPGRSKKSVLLSTGHSKASTPFFKKLSRFSALSVSIALGVLLAAVALCASVFDRGGSVAAFTESIATLQSNDCSTPKTSWNLGETACAGVSGASGQRRIIWVAPNGATAQVSPSFSDSGTDKYTIPSAGSGDPFAQVGTWSVVSIDNSGAGFAVANFVVRNPQLLSADLSVSIFGPSQVFPGGNATYVIEVDNHGPDAALGVTLSVPAPSNTVFSSSDCASLSGTTCTIGSLDPGATASVTYVFTVSNGAAENTFITLTATVSSTTSDSVQANNTAAYASPVVVTNPACTINCPSNITKDNDPNLCSAVVTYSTPTTSGNCADPETGLTPTVVCSPPSGTPFAVGTTVVVCSTGGTSCNFAVTVHDTRSAVQPTITCPSDVSTSETTPGSGSAIVNYPAPTTTGNCVTAVCSPPAGSSFPVGTTSVTCTGTDSSNNSVTCSFNVTVVSGNCTITCPGDITVNAAAGQCSAAVTFADPTTSGTCGAVTCTPASGSTFQAGSTVVTCTTSGGPTCDFTVTVNAAAAPTITTCASNRTVSVDANCEAAIPNLVGPTPPTEVVTTGCSVTLSQSPAAGTIVGPGAYTVSITAENSAGFVTCTATVTVADTTPPVITTTCPAGTSASADANCQAAVPNVTGGIVATDNCTPSSSLTITQSPAAGTLVSKGVTTITVTVKDAANNAATCTTTFTVNDTTPPTITCPADITRSNDPGLCSAVVSFAATVNDNCPGATANCSPASGSTFPKGTTTVTCTATDTSGNTSTACSFTVTVNDTEAPVLSCPASIIKPNDPNLCSAVVTYATATATDNCPGVGAVTCSPASGSVFPKGTTTVTCSATDASNNTGRCSFTVTVNDTQLPAITCPANITVEPTCPSGAVVNYATPVGTDNCPGAVTTQTAGLASGSIFPIGTTTNTFKVTDTSGNFVTCSFTVHVETPAEVIQDLINRVQALINQGVLNQANGQGLLNKLQSALNNVNSGNVAGACDNLDSFIDKVQGYIQHGTLTSAQGQPLIDSAKHAQNGLGCKPVSCS